MKEIKQWIDRRYNITNYLYQFENGIKLLHAVNPASKDFVISVVLRAGCCFEPQIDVPKGTAHFMEHMLINPNRRFKTQKEIDAFEYGDSKRPRLEVNAGTSHKYLYLYGFCNTKGAERLLERLSTVVGYPSEFFSKHIEKERQVILAELAREQKKEKDKEHMYQAFLVADELPHFGHRIIGESDDVSSLSTADLLRFHENVFLRENVVFAIQSPDALSKGVRDLLKGMAARFNVNDGEMVPPKEKLTNEYHTGYFHDEREMGVSLSCNYLFPVYKRVHYRDVVMYSILSDLLHKLGYDYLREERGLVYSFQSFHLRHLAFKFNVRGFECTTEIHKYPELLDGVHELLFSKILSFLKSDEGKRWFNNSVSRYIFPNTSSYEPDYAENRCLDVLEESDIYLFDKAVKVAKKLTRSDLVEYIEDKLLSLKPHVWIVSPEQDGKMMKILEKSSLAKEWGK